jgi:hypothetical protein
MEASIMNRVRGEPSVGWAEKENAMELEFATREELEILMDLFPEMFK